MIQAKTQISESLRLSVLLSFSGGLQDAYSYNVRGGVFANAQTGNVVLMSQSIMLGDWDKGLSYMLPIISFAAGVFLAERIESRFKNYSKVHWRQIILLVEVFMLLIVGFLPSGLNMLANIMVSFSCAMQVQAFRKVHGYGYASTMCIGNLRSGTEGLSQYFRTGEKESLYKAMHFFAIIFIFAIGAGVGGILSARIGAGTIWISSAILLLVTLMMTSDKAE